MEWILSSKFLRWPTKKVKKIVCKDMVSGIPMACAANQRCRRGLISKDPAVGFMHDIKLRVADVLARQLSQIVDVLILQVLTQ